MSKVVKRYYQQCFCEVFIGLITYESSQELKTLAQTLDNISVKWQRVCGVEWKLFSSLCFVGGLIDGLSTMSVDSLYSTLKPVTRPIDTKHKKVAFKDNENGGYS